MHERSVYRKYSRRAVIFVLGKSNVGRKKKKKKKAVRERERVHSHFRVLSTSIVIPRRMSATISHFRMDELAPMRVRNLGQTHCCRLAFESRSPGRGVTQMQASAVLSRRFREMKTKARVRTAANTRDERPYQSMFSYLVCRRSIASFDRPFIDRPSNDSVASFDDVFEDDVRLLLH